MAKITAFVEQKIVEHVGEDTADRHFIAATDDGTLSVVYSWHEPTQTCGVTAIECLPLGYRTPSDELFAAVREFISAECGVKLDDGNLFVSAERGVKLRDGDLFTPHGARVVFGSKVQ